MTQPDPKERKSIYFAARERVLKDPEAFICNNIIDAYEVMFGVKVDNDEECLKMFPEFFEQKPEGVKVGEGWFQSMNRDPEAHKKRIKVLQIAIIKVNEIR